MSAVSDLARELRSALEPKLGELAAMDESQRRGALQQALGAELTPAGLLERLALVDRAEGAGKAWRALIGVLGRSAPSDWTLSVAGLTAGPQTIQVDGTALPDGEDLAFSMDPVVIAPGRPGVRADQVALNLTLTDDPDKTRLRLDVKALRLDLPGEELLDAVAPGGVSFQADLVAVVDKTGFRFEGGGKNGVELPLRVVPPGLEGPTLYLGHRDDVDGLVLAASFRAAFLGMGSATVEHVGVELSPSPGGLVTPLTPRGFGVSMDLGPAKGSGYFERLPDGRYGGVLGMRLGLIDVKAFGLLRAQPFASLLIVITAEFRPPIELGLAITMNGVGGIAGISYAVNTDGLADAVQEGHIEDLLFPADPAAAAPRIIDTLGSVFREQKGSVLVGPMFRVGWGRPVSFVTADAAVIIELPSGVVTLLVRGRVALPAPEAPIIDLRISGFGIIDAANGLVELGASLTGSRLLFASIDGGFALRIKSGTDATFILSAGGFHPDFKPPHGFPTPKRLTIPIADTPLVQIIFSGYFAVTPATVQAGAGLTVSIGTSDLGVSGWVGFDALVRWEPTFGLSLDLAGAFDFHVAGESVCGIDLHVHVDGPTPCWHIAGHASVSLFFLELELPFDEHWGCSGEAAVPAAPNVGELLLEAARDPRSWAAITPEQSGFLVSLRGEGNAAADASAPRLLHPLGRVRFSQRVVPLGVEITRFGPGRLPQPRAFDVTVRFGDGIDTTPEPVMEDFARADFFELSDEQKLTEPAFERRRAGDELVPPAPSGLPMPHHSTRVLYETIWIGEDGKQRIRAARARASGAFLESALLYGAVATSLVHSQRSRHAAEEPDRVLQERSYAAVSVDTLREEAGIARATTLGDIRAAVAARPDLVGRIQIVPSAEVLS